MPVKLTVTACLALVVGLALFGWYERSQGAQQAEARAHADSLLHADSVNQAAIALRDSVRSKAAQDSLQVLTVRLRAAQQRREASQQRADSLAGAIASDSVVPRDTVAALVGAFQQERAAADSQIATLTTENTLLRGEISQKDSTIRSLNTLLDGNRAQLRQALAPQQQNLLSRGAELVVKGLALYGAVRLLGK